MRKVFSSVLIKSQELFASISLFRPAKAAAAATRPDILTEINVRASTKVADQASDGFSVDPPSQVSDQPCCPLPLEICTRTIGSAVGKEQYSATPP